MRTRRWPLADRWTRSRRAKVGVRSLLSRRRRPSSRKSRMEISSRCRARIGSEETVWHRSCPKQAFSKEKAAKKGKQLPIEGCPLSSLLNCATSVERPPAGGDWIHEIKFDGYRIQMRVESGEVTLKTRKGLDWTAKFGAIARAASALPDCIVDGEIVALDHRGSPDFAGLQAALSDGKTDDLIFFAFDLLFLEGRGSAAAEPCRPQAGFEEAD